MGDQWDKTEGNQGNKTEGKVAQDTINSLPPIKWLAVKLKPLRAEKNEASKASGFMACAQDENNSPAET